MPSILEKMEQAAREKVLAEMHPIERRLCAPSYISGAMDREPLLAGVLFGVRAAYAWLEANGFVPKETEAAPHEREPTDAGCRCQGCGRTYLADLIVPDDVWEHISPAPVGGDRGGGLLCAGCIMERISAAGIWTAGFACDIEDRPGRLEKAVLAAAEAADVQDA